jgi:hypothetical protein
MTFWHALAAFVLGALCMAVVAVLVFWWFIGREPQ